MSRIIKKLFGTIIILISLLAVDSCRKGEEDPLFSFHSRKDRVAGSWIITNYNKERSTEYSYPNKKTITQSYQQSFGLVNYKETTSDTGGTFVVHSGKMGRSSYFFYKSGKWSSIIEYYLYSPQAVGGFYISKTKLENDGTWEFQGKKDGFKNKESLLLKTENEKKYYYTYSTYLGTVVDSIADSTFINYGGEKFEVWKLIGLRTNRLKAEITSENSIISTVPGIAGTKITSSDKILIELN